MNATDAITPSRLIEILSLDTAEAESILFDRMRYLDRVHKLSYCEIGMICRTVEQYLLHESRIDSESGKPMSLTRWIRNAAPWSYSVCFSAKRDVEELKDVPAEQLAQIPPSNIGTMKILSSQVRSNPAVIEAAQSKSNKDFVKHIKDQFPDQHVTSKHIYRFSVAEDQAEDCDAALEWAIENDIAGSPSEAFHRMAVTALEQWKKESECSTR